MYASFVWTVGSDPRKDRELHEECGGLPEKSGKGVIQLLQSGACTYMYLESSLLWTGLEDPDKPTNTGPRKSTNSGSAVLWGFIPEAWIPMHTLCTVTRLGAPPSPSAPYSSHPGQVSTFPCLPSTPPPQLAINCQSCTPINVLGHAACRARALGYALRRVYNQGTPPPELRHFYNPI